jgi:hypothetical protein
MRVAIVNEAPYHLEIVAGFLHVLAQLPVDVTWYQAGQSVPAFSAVDLLEMVGFNQLLGFMPRMRPTTDKPEPVDFAVFVSPEYFERETQVRRQGSCRNSTEDCAAAGERGPQDLLHHTQGSRQLRSMGFSCRGRRGVRCMAMHSIEMTCSGSSRTV